MMDMAEGANRVYAVKTTAKQERTVADNILKAIETKATDIRVASIIVPNELQGYVLIETPEQRNRIEQLVELIAHAGLPITLARTHDPENTHKKRTKNHTQEKSRTMIS